MGNEGHNHFFDNFSPISVYPHDYQSLSYRFIHPEDYESLGIDTKDVPIGTFVAMDHPPFLPSRVGGNAYGFGFVEKSYLDADDIRFLETMEENDPRELSKHAARLNEIYKKLGLLVRVSYEGFRYYLIPINLITHSLQDVKCKADEIERVIIKHVFKRDRERLSVCILTSENDLLVHEISGRMPAMKIVALNNLERMKEHPGFFDVIILPQNIYEFLLGIVPETPCSDRGRVERLFDYACYLTGRIFDLLEPGGEFFAIANCFLPQHDQEIEVTFRSESELKSFLVFTHLFETEKMPTVEGSLVKLTLRDFYRYLNGAYAYDETMNRLIGDRSLEKLSLEEIERLPYLNIKVNETLLCEGENAWDQFVLPFFETEWKKHVLPDYLKDYFEKNLVSHTDLPGTLFLYLGKKKEPVVDVGQLKEELESSGLAGCGLALVAQYRDTFSYLLNVLDVVECIRTGRFEMVSESQAYRLRSVFEEGDRSAAIFQPVIRLIKKRNHLRSLENRFNPGRFNGKETSVLENLEKMSLLGFDEDLLREIVLVVLGHTSLGRVALGKFPERSLAAITEKAKAGGVKEVADIMRVSLLMSLAEIVSSLGNDLTHAQINELFAVYENVLERVSERGLDWDLYEAERNKALGGVFNRGVRNLLKLFNLFDFLDNWKEIINAGPFQRETLSDYDSSLLKRISKVQEIVKAAVSLRKRQCYLADDNEHDFFQRIIECRFHGTGHLLLNLDAHSGLILLQLAVLAAPNKMINFNPLARSSSEEEYRKKIKRYCNILGSMDSKFINEDYISTLRACLQKNIGPTFIPGTGFQLKQNPKTKALDVLHVDIRENLASLERMMKNYEFHDIATIPLEVLEKTETLFTELFEYYQYAETEGVDERESLGETAEFYISREQEIKYQLDQLRFLFRKQIFRPDSIFDNIATLASHCPYIFRYVVPEFQQTKELNLPYSVSGRGSDFVLRCLKKFQALIKKEKEMFQDQRILHRMAQQEFGPLTAESIAVSQIQLERLEAMTKDLAETPGYLDALGFSFFFSKGSVSGILEIQGEDLSSEGRNLLRFLTANSGTLMEVLFGEAPLGIMSSVTNNRSLIDLKAFFVREIVWLASIREGLMTEDMLDLCLNYYSLARKVVNGDYTWTEVSKKLCDDKARSYLSSRELTTGIPLADLRTELETGSFDGENSHLPHMRRKISSIERLFRLVGVLWIDYMDAAMAQLGIPENFIYRKKALRSMGIKRFMHDLDHVSKVCTLLENEKSNVKELLYWGLSSDSIPVCFFGFGRVTQYLDVDNWVKLLVLVLEIAKRFVQRGKAGERVNIDFRPLIKDIELRHEILNESLNGISTDWITQARDILPMAAKGLNGLNIKENRTTRTLEVYFKDPIDAVDIFDRLACAASVMELKKIYDKEMRYLDNLHFFTKDYQETLKSICKRRLDELNNSSATSGQLKLLQSISFTELETNYREIARRGSEDGYEKKHWAKIDWAYRQRKEKLCEDLLGSIQKRVERLSTREQLQGLWDEVKSYLLEYREMLGKKNELRVARIFDEKFSQICSSEDRRNNDLKFSLLSGD